MLEQPIIMVQIGERQWTLEMLRSACAWASERGGCVVLTQMVHLQHIIDLGRVDGYATLDDRQLNDLQHFADVVADSGVECRVQIYQYCDAFSAIVEAALQAGAQVVFARMPHSLIPFWSECRFEVLRRHLEQHGVEVYDRPVSGLVGDGLPSWGDRHLHLSSQL